MISVLLPTKSRLDLFRKAYGSLLVQLADFKEEEYEIIIVNDNLYSQDMIGPYLEKLGINFILGRSEGCAWAFQYAADAASGDKLLFINDDMFFFQPFLWPMLESFYRGNKIVGAKLVYEDMSLQHAGMDFFPDKNWMADHLFRGYPSDYPEANIGKNVPCVTFSLTLVDAKLFYDLGGFDKGYGGSYEDTDFALRALERGEYIYYEPRATAIHYESQTRGFDPALSAKTFAKFRGNWILNGRLERLLQDKGFMNGTNTIRIN